MKLIKEIVKTGISLKNRFSLSQEKAAEYQLKTLKKLLTRAKDTRFGGEYGFGHILSADDPYQAFASQVPVSNYGKMLKWWQMSLNGERSVCWPGHVKYFALSSGTSEGSSKYIPVTTDMLKAIKRASLKQIISIARTDLPKDYMVKHYLMIGGSTDLEYNGVFYSGDLSGITTGTVPSWFERFSKPEMDIRRTRNWQEKIDKLTENAKNYDVVMIAGVPAWIQLLFENIIKKYQLTTIHDIWPNLTVYIHGGVSLDPYKRSFERLLGKPLMYFETYLASEGFMAFQTSPDAKGMRLLLRNGIFFEFIPFTKDNFTEEGELRPDPQVLTIDQVELGKEYALLITTCSGAYRYMIGDVVKFVSLRNCEIKITGRTKHFLSLCGEHLSVDNMNRAIELLAREFNTDFNEFSVVGVPHGGLFAHQWYIACDDASIKPEQLRQRLDETLKVLNDDYAVERRHALRDIQLELIPHDLFLGWMRKNGKEGGSFKFPRVMNKAQYEDWKEFLNAQRVNA